MDGQDVCVGMTVRFRPGFETPLSEAAAGIVTAVGNGQIDVHVFYPTMAQPDVRTGVMHSTNPRAKRNLEHNDEAGIWDYVLPQPPEEVDKSDNKEATQGPKPPKKRASPVTAIADNS